MPQQKQTSKTSINQIKLMTELQSHLRRTKIVNVPHYDATNDRFVFDDGRVVANNDPIFSRFKWA